jgi:hypothetical protein
VMPMPTSLVSLTSQVKVLSENYGVVYFE